MPERNPQQPPLRPPHRPMERRLSEQFVIDPNGAETKPITPLHSDRYGKLAVDTTVSTDTEHYQWLEEQAYI